MRAAAFCLIGCGFWEIRFFSLSFMVFGRRIEGLCNHYFTGDFVFLVQSG